MADRNLKILELISDIRKFEIGLFWSRSLFFWGFTAIAIAAFGAAYNYKSQAKEVQFVIACAGFISSVVWLLVNRSSKYWQKVWEQKAKDASLEAVGRNIFEELLRSKLVFCALIKKFPWWDAHFSVRSWPPPSATSRPSFG